MKMSKITLTPICVPNLTNIENFIDNHVLSFDYEKILYLDNTTFRIRNKYGTTLRKSCKILTLNMAFTHMKFSNNLFHSDIRLGKKIPCAYIQSLC